MTQANPLFSFPSKKAKNPNLLVEEALKGFTEAQVKLEAAQDAIAVQMAEHEAEIRLRQEQLNVATESHSRLARVKARFADLIS